MAGSRFSRFSSDSNFSDAVWRNVIENEIRRMTQPSLYASKRHIDHSFAQSLVIGSFRNDRAANARRTGRARSARWRNDINFIETRSKDLFASVIRVSGMFLVNSAGIVTYHFVQPLIVNTYRHLRVRIILTKWRIFDSRSANATLPLKSRFHS